MFSRAEQTNAKSREKMLKIEEYCFLATNNADCSWLKQLGSIEMTDQHEPKCSDSRTCADPEMVVTVQLGR